MSETKNFQLSFFGRKKKAACLLSPWLSLLLLCLTYMNGHEAHHESRECVLLCRYHHCASRLLLAFYSLFTTHQTFVYVRVIMTK